MNKFTFKIKKERLEEVDRDKLTKRVRSYGLEEDKIFMESTVKVVPLVS